MSEIAHLKELKSVARKLARIRRIKHVGALEIVAAALGYPHWKALALDAQKGWSPTPADLETANALLAADNPMGARGIGPLSAFDDAEEREIMGHRFTIGTEYDDIVLVAEGWSLRLPEAPSKSPEIYVSDPEDLTCPVHDPQFVVAALDVALERQQQVYARIAADWPRRSSVLYPDGRAEHPLTGQVSTLWYCLHCDEEATSQQMVDNLWHCPACSASPIDTFASRWWLGEEPQAGPGRRA